MAIDLSMLIPYKHYGYGAIEVKLIANKAMMIAIALSGTMAFSAIGSYHEIGYLLEDEEPVVAGTETGTSKKLGITVQELTPKLAESLGMEETQGLIITDINAGSAAAEAGIQRGDIILEINREKVESVAQYKKALQAAQEKKTILLLIKRDQHTRFVVVELKE